MKKYVAVFVLASVLIAGSVQAATLSAAQTSAIISLLKAFGADASIISNVSAALSGGRSGGVSGSSSGNSSSSSSGGINYRDFPSITVISPNGGETIASSISSPTMLIQWRNSTDLTPNNSLVTINLCNVEVHQTTRCPATNSTNVVSGLRNTGQYSAVLVTPDGSVTPAGRYVVLITATRSDGLTTSDVSDNYFTIFDRNIANRPPVITGLKAPSNLKLGETGTWAVTAYDPEGGALTYTVDWGEPRTAVAKSSSLGQEASFTHVYNSAGTYRVSITVVDNMGQAAVTSATVNVASVLSADLPRCGAAQNQPSAVQPTTDLCAVGQAGKQRFDEINWYWSCQSGDAGTNANIVNCSAPKARVIPAPLPVPEAITVNTAITVTSPQSNEVWRRGNLKNIKWQTTNVPADGLINVRLVNKTGQVVDLFRKVPNTGLVQWVVGDTADKVYLPAGFYQVRVCIAGPTGGCDKSSDQLLEIKEKSDGTSAGTAGAVGSSSFTLWDWLGKIITGQ